jgi:ribosomal protein S18 acetylase RimI-like enzyme
MAAHDHSRGVDIRPVDQDDATVLAALRWRFRSDPMWHDRPDAGPPIEARAEFTARAEHWMHRRLATGTWSAWLAELSPANGGPAAVGMVWLHLLEKLPNPVVEPEWHGYLSSLWVDPAWRGRAVDSRLIGAVLARTEAAGAHAVILWPTPASRPLYARHGFTGDGEVMVRTPYRPPPACPRSPGR